MPSWTTQYGLCQTLYLVIIGNQGENIIKLKLIIIDDQDFISIIIIKDFSRFRRAGKQRYGSTCCVATKEKIYLHTGTLKNQINHLINKISRISWRTLCQSRLNKNHLALIFTFLSLKCLKMGFSLK